MSATGGWLVSNLNYPCGITIDTTNTYLYVTNFINGSINRINISTQTISSDWIITNLSGLIGITIDSTNTNLYAISYYNNNIVQININTKTTTVWPVTGLNQPYGIIIDPTNTYLYVASYIGKTITRINISTKTTSSNWIVTNLLGPFAVAVDSTNTYLYITDGGGTSGTIKQINIATSTITNWSVSGLTLNQPYGITIDSTNNYLYISNNISGIINQIDITTKTKTNWLVSGLINCYQIIIDPTNTYLYLANTGTKQINRITISLGCFLKGTKILTNKSYVKIQKLKKGDLVKTLNNGLVSIKFIGKRSFFNKITEERMNAHLYKLKKNDFPELKEDLYITGGHPILIDNPDKETNKKLLDMIDYDTSIITEGKYRLFSFINPKAELWNDEGIKEVYDIVLENEDPYRNYGIWANGILTESMNEHFFLNYSGMIEINKDIII